MSTSIDWRPDFSNPERQDGIGLSFRNLSLKIRPIRVGRVSGKKMRVVRRAVSRFMTVQRTRNNATVASEYIARSISRCT